jgi:hypothetical protein
MRVTLHDPFLLPAIFFFLFCIELGLDGLGFALVVHTNRPIIAGTKPSDLSV